ncbi:DIP1984 family protein [Nocardia farcinica]|uniref:DIP1984 family protein n=1 Tax=Nocardia farcinica TaxID=37329 RepID=UPI0034392BFB
MGADGTRTDALARRDALRLQHSVITDAADAAAGKNRGGYGRQLRSELKILSAPRTGESAQRTPHNRVRSVTARAGTGYSTEFAALREVSRTHRAVVSAMFETTWFPWGETAPAPVASAVQHRSPHRAGPESTVLPADRLRGTVAQCGAGQPGAGASPGRAGTRYGAMQASFSHVSSCSRAGVEPVTTPAPARSQAWPARW